LWLLASLKATANSICTGKTDMNADVRNKFSELGAVVDEDGNVAFDTQHAPGVLAITDEITNAPNNLCDLSRLAVVDVTGKDAAEFIQAQVCNDLNLLQGQQVQINGYCNPKGRLLALFTVFQIPDGFRLLVSDDVAPAFIKRLKMYVLRALVSIEQRTDLLATGLSLSVNELANVKLPDTLPALPDETLQLSSSDSVSCFRWHPITAESAAGVARDRYVYVGPAETLLPLWDLQGLAHAPWSYWRWGDIAAGIPNVYADSVEEFIPLMMNMQLIDGLSFKKGCYPGQEIVARMHYLGKLKKHMVLLYQPEGSDIPAPGTVLSTETNNNAGQVVDAVADATGIAVLAVVNKTVPVNELLLSGKALVQRALPYALPEPVEDKDS